MLAPTALGLLAGVLVVQAVFGSVHAITLGFAATLIGESVDYPSYILLNAQAGETAGAAARRVGRTLLLAVLTTVASALALALSSFTGLAQLGVLTMVGVVVAGLTAHRVVPWLLGDHVLRLPRLRVPDGAVFARGRWPRAVALVATLGAVGGLWVAHPDWWEHELANISPVSAAMRAQDASLRREMGAPDVSVFLASSGASEASGARGCRGDPAGARALAGRGTDPQPRLAGALPALTGHAGCAAALPCPMRRRSRRTCARHCRASRSGPMRSRLSSRRSTRRAARRRSRARPMPERRWERGSTRRWWRSMANGWC